MKESTKINSGINWGNTKHWSDHLLNLSYILASTETSPPPPPQKKTCVPFKMTPPNSYCFHAKKKTVLQPTNPPFHWKPKPVTCAISLCRGICNSGQSFGSRGSRSKVRSISSCWNVFSKVSGEMTERSGARFHAFLKVDGIIYGRLFFLELTGFFYWGGYTWS